MNRVACTLALAVHLIAFWAWPTPASWLPALSEPTPTEISSPMAVAFLTLEPSADSASPLLTANHVSEPEPRNSLHTTSSRHVPRRSPEVSPATRLGASSQDGAHSLSLPSGNSILRMRTGQPSSSSVSPLRGSLLQAAIDRVSRYVPPDPGRRDLLGAPSTTSTPSPAPSAWRDSGGGTKRVVGEPFEATISRDGLIHFEDRPNVAANKDASIRFDATDAVMASLGEVLYPYRKLKLMDQSREMRAGMAQRANREALQDSVIRHSHSLSSLWLDVNTPLGQRKQLLFVLWDECAETGSPRVVSTADSIRAETLDFIRQVLPADTPDAYTREELSTLNARRQSRQRFEPYLPMAE